jgi:transcriptional regulator PpsR
MTPRIYDVMNHMSFPMVDPESINHIVMDLFDVGLVLSQSGVIESARIDASVSDHFKSEDPSGRKLSDLLTRESVAKFEQRMQAISAGQPPTRPLELNHKVAYPGPDLPIRYLVRPIDTRGTVLLLGRDMRPIARQQQQLVEAQQVLERDYELERESSARFQALMETINEAVVVLSLTDGAISHANTAAATLLGITRADLVGSHFANLFPNTHRKELLATLEARAVSKSRPPVIATLLGSEQQIKLRPNLFRTSGERHLICYIDLYSPDGQVDGTIEVNLRELYDKCPDGIVFADRTGRILAINEGFLDYVGEAHESRVQGETLSDFLDRGMVDLTVLIESTLRNGRLRAYSTSLLHKLGEAVAVEVAVTQLSASGQDVFAFVFRSLGGGTSELARAPSMVSEDKARSLLELVGSSSLREILSETTEVVERMCIEAALDLTSNNRAAASEMLGLSRQSLYVKLRKYGLLSKDTHA